MSLFINNNNIMETDKAGKKYSRTEGVVYKLAKSIKEQAINQAPQQPKAQPFVVVFDKGQQGEFRVKFSERGFLVDGTRLSFETVEEAISKGYFIHLNNGQGIVLDSVRMQKILKYKNAPAQQR